MPAYIPAWNPKTIYSTPGTQVVDQGAIFSNSYWTQGDDPLISYQMIGGPWSLVSGSPPPNPNPAAPSAPTGVTSAFTDDHLIALTWNPATVPGVGTVSSYEIFMNGQLVGTSTTNHYTATGLTGSTSYNFSVDAIDATGTSSMSATYAVSTLAPYVHSGKLFSPYVDVGLATTEDLLAISQTLGHLDYTLAFIQSSGLQKFTGSIDGNVLTVTAMTSGTVWTHGALVGSGITPGTEIISQISGTTGGVGTYLLNGASQHVASQAIREATIGWAGTGTIDNDGFPDNPGLPTIQEYVQTLQSESGTVTISFGGASGVDPAVQAADLANEAAAPAVAIRSAQLQGQGKTEAAALAQAKAEIVPSYYAPYITMLQAEYQSVIDRYGVTHLDFDIEGGAVANKDSMIIRDRALVALEAANPNLKISFTLPVLPSGLDSNGVAAINYAVQDGLRVDVVNIMAMDYGAISEIPGADMGDMAIAAATNTHAQLQAAGLNAKVGITPMLGINDVVTEIFTTADAEKLEAWAARTPWVASIGYWSLARDNNDEHAGSLTSSGTAQTRWEFAEIFSPIAVGIQAKATDFNGDTTSDIMFRNVSTGDMGFYQIANGAVQSWKPMGGSSTTYSIVGIGDFNGGGTSDLLFRNNANGDMGYDEMNSGALPTWHALGGSSAAYSVDGIGDFNGDGVADILFRNHSTGDFGWDEMGGGALPIWHAQGGSSTAYAVVGIGDFSGDGISDVLFRNNSTGDIGYDQMNPGGLPTWRPIGGSSTAYSVVGVGDFNGDGVSDVLFRNSANGSTGYYQIANGTFGSWHDLGIVAAGSSVAGTGDYSGDGIADILLRNNTTGALAYDQVAGSSLGLHQLGGSSTAYAVQTA